jgi:hypothetical protein
VAEEALRDFVTAPLASVDDAPPVGRAVLTGVVKLFCPWAGADNNASRQAEPAPSTVQERGTTLDPKASVARERMGLPKDVFTRSSFNQRLRSSAHSLEIAIT